MRILLLAGEGRSTRILFHRLEQLFGDVQVIVEGDVPRWTFLSRRVKSLGLMTVVGQVLFKLLIIPGLQNIRHVRQSEILMDGNMDDGPIPESRILRVVSANDKQTVEVVKVAHPDLIVINGTRILSNRLLTSAKVPWINMHAGITPLYRGVHGGYWALVRHEPEVCGVTVHLVDPGIDTGGILNKGSSIQRLVMLLRRIPCSSLLLGCLSSAKQSRRLRPAHHKSLRIHQVYRHYGKPSDDMGVPLEMDEGACCLSCFLWLSSNLFL